MYDDYKDRCFTIIAFPCNQFGHLEPGTPGNIKEAVKQYNV